ncbi:MAG: hypothetical protein QF412_10295 [Planctomycetota bacterium]|jgi:hypothetical protein|nr:hypothetical protein [Planctomycetota bacterium]
MVINRSMILLAGAALVLIVALCMGNPFLRQESGDDSRGRDSQGMPTSKGGGPAGEAVPIDASGAANSGVPTSLGDGQSLEDPQDAPQDPDAGGDDPQNIGPCPEAYAGIPVVRSGFDELGRETWWHEDGSFTQRFLQTVREADGSSYQVPAVLHAAPSGRRR